MYKILGILATTAAMGFAVSTYAADESGDAKSTMELKKNGGYEAKSSSDYVDQDGTAHSSKESVDVDVNSKGLAQKTVKAQEVTDPKGLMNKVKDTAETTIDEKPRGGYKQTTTRKHTDANGTNITYKTTTNVDVDKDGNITTTSTTEKTVDPKGLMNETVSKTKTRTVNGNVVEDTQTTK